MKRTDIKLLSIVTGGVLAAGYLMYMFQDAPVIGDARMGYGGR